MTTREEHEMAMRVVVLGASGNTGTSLVPLLTADERVESVAGVARRVENMPFPEVEWHSADIAGSDLRPILDGANAVVHLAWAIQPSHHYPTLWTTNVVGSRRVFEAAAEAGVSTIVYASSIGAYSAGTSDERVDESWPVGGTPTSFYGRHKATVEWFLDDFERAHPDIRVVRMRPALIFKRPAATGIRRLFAGPFLPSRLVRPGTIPAVPTMGHLAFQAVHSDDVAVAYREALHREVAGAFNLAAEPVLGIEDLADYLQAGTVDVSLPLVRLGAALSWAARLQPTPPGWLDMAGQVPRMSSTRAQAELGWQPRYTAREALRELLDGMGEAADFPTPPLSRATAGILRRREIDGSAYRPKAPVAPGR